MKRQARKPVFLWFEQLTILKLIFSVLYKCFSPNIEIRYPASSSLANRLVTCLKRQDLFHWVGFQELFLGVQTQKGENLRYKAEELTDAVVQSVFRIYLSGNDYVPNHLHNDISRIHLAYEARLVEIFRQKIRFMCAVDHLHQTNAAFMQKRPSFCLDYIPISGAFKKAISSSHEWRLLIWPDLKTIVKELVPLKAFYAALRFFFPQCLPRQRLRKYYQELSKDMRGKILVEFFRPIHITDEGFHLFWFPRSGIPAERVVMGFDTDDSLCSRENVQVVERRKMRWLDLELKALTFHTGNPLRMLSWSFFHTPFPKAFTVWAVWRWKTMLEFVYFLQVWQHIFSRYRITAFYQYQEHTFWNHIQSLALSREGGLYFWFHGSIDRFPVAHFHPGFCDVYFSWGKFHRDYLDIHRFQYRYVLDVGLVWDNAYRARTEMSYLPKNNISQRANFIIALFDGGSSLWNQYSPSAEGYFYESLLQMILEHTGWAAIIKPKRFNCFDILPNRKRIAALIDTLAEQGRCLLLTPRHPPFRVAHEANICVCHGINSAGSIVGLTGCRVIHWDLSGNIRHPYYLNAVGHFIFQTREEIRNVLESFARNRKKSPDLGDHSPWFNILDPYRDGKAGLRAGQFLKTFLKNRDEGKSPEIALAESIKKFAGEWGEDKVFAYETKPERLKDNIWMEAERTLRR